MNIPILTRARIRRRVEAAYEATLSSASLTVTFDHCDTRIRVILQPSPMPSKYLRCPLCGLFAWAKYPAKADNPT